MNSSPAVGVAETDTSQLEKLTTGCMYCILQCEQLLQQVSESSYIESRDGVSSIGEHMRHVLDRFQCFFNGLQDGYVDYDARKRDKSIESNLQAARFALASIARRIQEFDLPSGTMVEVRESVHHLSPQVVIDSTVARELMGLITHTTHHLAIIGMIARNFGYSLDSDFGKAPSTIVFERS